MSYESKMKIMLYNSLGYWDRQLCTIFWDNMMSWRCNPDMGYIRYLYSEIKYNN